MSENEKEHVMSEEEVLNYCFEHGTQFKDGRGTYVVRARCITDQEVAFIMALWRPDTGDGEQVVENLRRQIRQYQDKVVTSFGLSKEAALNLLIELASALDYHLLPTIKVE